MMSQTAKAIILMSCPKSEVVLLAVVLICCLPASNGFSTAAFPGAEGAGANAVGGRGGDLYFVSNTNDTGAGSLRNGITSATGPRTILFNVSGTVDLQSNLRINKPFLTIAGQTAPGDGITLRRRVTSVQDTHDVIVRFIRCRPGDIDSTFEDDSFHFVHASNSIVDHVSASWSVDECLSVTHSTNVTVQWCMIGESLRNSQHTKGAHGYGTLLRYGAGELTFHHNLYQHHDSRNPRLGDRLKLDFVNNVIYNWGGTAGYSGGNGPTEDAKDNPGGVFTNHMNYVSNYLVAGPSTTSPTRAFKSGATNTVIYQIGNRIDSNKNSALDGTDTDWSMFTRPYTVSLNRYPLPAVTSDSAGVAYQRVLAFAGASAVRDEVDLRLLGNVRDHLGAIVDAVGTGDQATDYVTNNIGGVNHIFVRGWPMLNSTAPPADDDNDGMADYWELALGLSTSEANNNHTNSDGYTDLEWYLNWLAGLHAVSDRNGNVDINLAHMIGTTNNFVFTVADGTNGSVTLLEDGRTARFAPVSDYCGLAEFTFIASNAVDHAGFGPVSVSVLVSITNAPAPPNTPPMLAAIPDYIIKAGETLTFTNSASDTNDPMQTLMFALTDEPAGATITATDGVFHWRPAIAQGGTTNDMSVVVSDNGIPSLSATQSFAVTVNQPAEPVLQVPVIAGGQFNLVVGGDTGPDYIIQASADLTNWESVFITNSPALPLLWKDEDAGSHTQRFFRVLLGP